MNSTKLKNLFPKLPSGGYTARFRFTDEGRGERFFDQAWSVFDYLTPGKFQIGPMVDFRGFIIHAQTSWPTIGRAIQPGDQICVTAIKWNRRGACNLPSRTIRIKTVEQDAETGVTIIHYE